MITLQKAFADMLRTDEKGRWMAREGQPFAGKSCPIVLLTCPECGKIGALTDHKVDDAGGVTPSVVCGCGFHEYVKLEDWKA